MCFLSTVKTSAWECRAHGRHVVLEVSGNLGETDCCDTHGLLIRFMQSIFSRVTRGRGIASSFIHRLHRKPSRMAQQIALYTSDVLASHDHTRAGTIVTLANNLNAVAHYRRTNVRRPTHGDSGQQAQSAGQVCVARTSLRTPQSPVAAMRY